MNASQIKLVIVDDHMMFLDGIQSILSTYEHIVIRGIAKNGKDAIKLIKQQQPSIVITDIEMPEINGIELTKYVKKVNENIGVIVVSSHSNSKMISDAIKAGASSYIFKNTGKKELIDTIERVYTGENYFSNSVRKILNNSLYSPKKIKQNVIKLSKREIQVLTLISKEKNTHEISKELFISVNTVETHRKNLMRKIGTKNMIGLAKYAIQQGIV